MDIIATLRNRHDVPVIIVDQLGLIEYINPAFEQVFLWKAEEALGKPLSIIIPPELQDAHNLGFSRFLMTHQPTLLNKPLKLLSMDKNERVFYAEHVIYAQEYADGWKFAATLVPEQDEVR